MRLINRNLFLGRKSKKSKNQGSSSESKAAKPESCGAFVKKQRPLLKRSVKNSRTRGAFTERQREIAKQQWRVTQKDRISTQEYQISRIQLFSKAFDLSSIELPRSQLLGQNRTSSEESSLLGVLHPVHTISTSDLNDLELRLVNNNIFPEGFRYLNGRLAPKPNNLGRILQVLLTTSVELSRFTEVDFQRFQHMNNTISRNTLMRRIIPILEGNTDIPNDGQMDLDNLAPLVGGIERQPEGSVASRFASLTGHHNH
ncbi:hypothetical protein TrVGV298_002193 [Trichoderma virens]|nr:hypothetical protein TrVGV298_002193 [Trichoderma virens]